MTRVNIAILKAQLTKYLRSVRQGKEIVVFDRETPVARLLPWKAKEKNRLPTYKPTQDPTKLGSLFTKKGRLAQQDQEIDSLSVLLDMRYED